MKRLIVFIKNWMLPVSMTIGILTYFAFANIDFLAPAKPTAHKIDEFLTPTLIFAQLFIQFCKIDLRQIRIKTWFWWLVLIQLGGGLLLYFLLIPLDMFLAQGALVCMICPTATATAVITEKLGGSAETIISYIILINLIIAIFVPIVFPLIYPQEGMEFFQAFFTILGKVFPLLALPLIFSQIVQRALPKAHNWLRNHTVWAFYIWALALALAIGKATKAIVDDSDFFLQVVGLCVIAILTCGFQFLVGKVIGGNNGERISGGQAMGQKNTVLAIWMTCTYLAPLTSVAPGAYIFCHNIVNSYQLWKKREKDQLSQ